MTAMSWKLGVCFGSPPPSRAGARPRLALFFCVCAFGLAQVGCSPSGADQVTNPIDLGMTSKLTPYYGDQNITLYQVQTPVALPVRKPT